MTDMELADLVENGRLRFYWVKRDGKARDVEEQIIAALRRGHCDDPMSSNYIPLCAGHAETWFTGRDHLKDGMKATCVVCAFERHPSGEMVSMRKVRKVLVNFDVSTSVDDYEFRGDEGAYTPNDKDCVLLTDFAHGLIGELCEALGKLSAAEAEGRKG